MKSLLFTPTAISDLYEILEYVAKDRPHTAVQVIARIRQRCELLVDHPEIGQVYPNFGYMVRGIPQQRWIICYRVEAESIQILRVLDAARDIDLLLS